MPARHIRRSYYQNAFMSYPPVRKLPIGGPIELQRRHIPRVFDGLLHNHAKLIDAGEIRGLMVSTSCRFKQSLAEEPVERSIDLVGCLLLRVVPGGHDDVLHDIGRI